jgi:hypothetical protein
MDVLQLLKAEFRERKVELSALEKPETSETAKRSILRALDAHLAWEAEFLEPELRHVIGRGDTLFDRYRQSLNDLKISGREKDQKVSDLLKAFDKHRMIVEEKVLPFMRQKISTSEREELYHVFVDAKQELLSHYHAKVVSH